MVQVAAMRSEAEARAEWDRLAQAHPDLLDGFSLVVQRADLGARGVFHRARAEGAPTLAAARDLCTALKARGADCWVAP